MIEWFNKEAGSDVLVQREERGDMICMLNGAPPDYARIPGNLGGGVAKILSRCVGPCPQCEESGRFHFTLEGTDLRIAECKVCGFVWYRLPALSMCPHGVDCDGTTLIHVFSDQCKGRPKPAVAEGWQAMGGNCPPGEIHPTTGR